jgi:hypothetical protein
VAAKHALIGPKPAEIPGVSQGWQRLDERERAPSTVTVTVTPT